jgi:predicted secreted protein
MAAIEQMVVRGKAGQPIELPIAEGPATGYSWQLELPDGVIRLEDGPPRTPPEGKHLGAAIGGAIRVQAPQGRFSLTARLVRPWGGDAVRAVAIDLIVD